nr:SMP-30/gluconolactonase/LRE family protein [Mesorhizobium sp. B2-5-3]
MRIEILLLSDVPAEQILLSPKGSHRSSFAIRPATPMATPGTAKGVCSPARAAIVASSAPNLTGRQTVLADSYEGKRLNSPNDIVVRSDDSIWFTDPDYGTLSDYTGNRASSELGRRCVFRLDPLDGKLAIATDKLDKPQWPGLPAHRENPFVADSGATHTPGWRT